jgi:phage-related minor tail protein
MDGRSDEEQISLDAGAIQTTLRDLEGRASSFGNVLSRALKQSVVDGRELDTVLRGVAGRLSSIALDIGLQPLERLATSAMSSLTASLGGAMGGAAARIVPFAKGGVVASPTFFPAGNDLGLMGEAGAEAILPLRRGADGRLGVAAGDGGAGTPIIFNVSSPDADSFRKSEAQITAMLARAVGRGRRGL